MNASMISLRWVLVATSVLLLACGADGSDTDDEPSGGAPTALPDGGSTTRAGFACATLSRLARRPLQATRALVGPS